MAMTKWVRVFALVCILSLMAGCTFQKVDGMGHFVPMDEAVRMAKEGSPLVEVTSTETYTAPPTVHVIHGTDQDGRQVIMWVYTYVIRYAYAEDLISAERAREIAGEAGFPVKAVRETSLQVFQGSLDGRENPVFWRLGTKAGWIWVDAETETILKRLDAE
jgi:uncharacterized protein YpmB